MAKDLISWRTAIADVTIQDTLRQRTLERHSAERRRIDTFTERILAVNQLTDRELPLFVAQGEILVRLEDSDRALEILKGRGFAMPEPVRCKGRCPTPLPVVVFEKPNASIDELQGAVDALVKEKINASFNHVLPDGGAKNGLTGPTAVSGPAALTTKPAAEAGAGVVVAVIDTGIAECIEARDDPSADRDEVLVGIDVRPDNTDLLNAINQSQSPSTDFLDMGAGHGTFVAGVIRQIAPKADVRVYRALDSDGIGSEVGVACAIVQAWHDGANIINLSLGQESYLDRPPVALQAALELISDDVVVVASAGNLDDKRVSELDAMRPHWPAAFRRVVAVGGVDAHYDPAPWSKRGQWVDVSTWGEDVVSTYVWGEEEPDAITNPAPDVWKATDPTPWARWSGTSFSAPQLTGMIAAGVGPHQSAHRARARYALSDIMARGYWHEDKYGLIVPTPFLT